MTSSESGCCRKQTADFSLADCKDVRSPWCREFVCFLRAVLVIGMEIPHFHLSMINGRFLNSGFSVQYFRTNHDFFANGVSSRFFPHLPGEDLKILSELLPPLLSLSSFFFFFSSGSLGLFPQTASARSQ